MTYFVFKQYSNFIFKTENLRTETDLLFVYNIPVYDLGAERILKNSPVYYRY